MRRPLVLFALLLSCGSSKSPSAANPAPATPASPGPAAARPADNGLPEAARDPREAILATAARELLHEHVLGKPIDDGVSKEAFQRLIEDLDSTKLFLLESDVQRLAKYAQDMDDELRAGDLVLGRKAIALLQSRRRVVADIIAGILAKPLDFTTKESIDIEPKKRAFCKSEAELTTRWRGVLKLQVLERTQELEDILDKRAHPKPNDKAADPDEAKRDAAAEKALGEIPATFEGRRDKVQKEIASRFATQFVRRAAVDKLEPAQMFINAVNGAFDPHTTYLPPAEEAELGIALTGRLEGIGATLREQEHYIQVNDLVPGGAAWQQGKLEVGDLIMAVTQAGQEPVDVMDMPIGKVVSMIRGPKGTVVVLTVKKADGSVKTISIMRDVVRIEASYARGAIIKTKGSGEVGYLHLPGFYGESRKPGERNATEDVRAILAQLTKKGITSLVFDLRGNGGGLLTHARDIAGLFVKEGPVVQTKDGKGEVEVLRDTDPSVAFDGNVVILVDRFCASAAEIVAGALQDYERAVVVGTSATHGKGTVQAVIDLDQQLKGATKLGPLGLYKVTVQEYFRVSGGSTQLKGVVPDILLPDPTSFIESGERTLPHAIPWTTIAQVSYTKTPHAWRTADLASASAARTSANADFATVSRLVKNLEARKARSLEPLERTAWQAEHNRAKADLEALDPKRHDKKPLMEVVPLPGQAGTSPAQDPRVQQQLDKWKDGLARDLWVDETTHILADMKKRP